MKAALKNAALFAAVACFVWIAVLWRWRAWPRDIDAGDIAIGLGLLPVAVFCLLWAVRRAVRGALTPPAAPAATAGAHSAAAVEAPWHWHLLGAWARTAAGADVDELLAAIEAGAPRPRPDPTLHDDGGLPVMTARIAELDTASVEASLRRAAAALPADLDGRPPAPASVRAVRALASLAPLVDELVEFLQVWTARPAQTASSAVQDERIVRVLVAWPADWDDAACAVAQAWLAERLCAPLAAALPPSRWAIRGQRMSGNELLAAAEHTLNVLRGQGRDDPLVLMACHSDLDAAGIRALASQQRLFHSQRRPKVAMAGESAAVLVFSAVAWPADAAPATAGVRLASPAVARRSQSIEAAGRASSDDAVTLVGRALASAGLAGAAVAKLASDADQHTARATELFAVALALMPELDANEDLRLAGTLVGRLEAAAPLLTLALAATQARDSGRPAVALSLADPHWRMAAVLWPDSFSTASEPA